MTGLKSLVEAALGEQAAKTIGGSASQGCLIKHSSSVDSMQSADYIAPMPSIKSLPEFDAAQYLDSDAAVAAYLTDILEANDPALLAAALGDIARARGMSEIAKASGLTREALYKALRPDAQPRFDTISRVCTALGVRLVAQPA